MINLFFEFIKIGKVKVRIMFAQNAFVSDGLTKKGNMKDKINKSKAPLILDRE